MHLLRPGSYERQTWAPASPWPRGDPGQRRTDTDPGKGTIPRVLPHLGPRTGSLKHSRQSGHQCQDQLRQLRVDPKGRHRPCVTGTKERPPPRMPLWGFLSVDVSGGSWMKPRASPARLTQASPGLTAWEQAFPSGLRPAPYNTCLTGTSESGFLQPCCLEAMRPAVSRAGLEWRRQGLRPRRPAGAWTRCQDCLAGPHQALAQAPSDPSRSARASAGPPQCPHPEHTGHTCHQGRRRRCAHSP